MATYAPPRGLVPTMHMTVTEHVQSVKTNDGRFPALHAATGSVKEIKPADVE